MVLTLGLAGSALVRGWLYPGHFGDARFDRRVWIAQKDDCARSNPRGKMYDDLVDHHLARGMSRAVVVRRLGPPDLVSGSSLHYGLGRWSGFRLDCDFLYVQFDGRARLQRFGRWRD